MDVLVSEPVHIVYKTDVDIIRPIFSYISISQSKVFLVCKFVILIIFWIGKVF